MIFLILDFFFKGGEMCDFSLKSYREMLRIALECGYEFMSFTENGTVPVVYLRHDIDISLDNALKIAQIENDFGIRATFLPYLHSPTYNFLCEDSISKMKQILGMGHFLCLHYDPVSFRDTPETIESNIRFELEFISRLLGIKAEVISFHRPTQIPFEYRIDIDDVIITYSPKFFEEIFYYSDSRYEWKYGCPCQIFQQREFDTIQLLIHPFWWNETPDSLEQLIAQQKKRQGDVVSQYFEKEIMPVYFNGK